MRSQELEYRVINIVDRAVAGQPVEDSFVELKSEWPSNVKRTARQIAGHSNASRGEDIVWIIGVDENNQSLVGAENTELANWWPMVEKSFQEVAPDLHTCISIPIQDKTVVALVFRTDRCPYLIIDGDKHEVPYRDGNRTRSARRQDMLRMLVPISKTPSVEVIRNNLKNYHGNVLHCVMELYLTPHTTEPLNFPRHQMALIVKDDEKTVRIRCDKLDIKQLNIDTGIFTQGELRIVGPGRFIVECRIDLLQTGQLQEVNPLKNNSCSMELHLAESNSVAPVVVCTDTFCEVG